MCVPHLWHKITCSFMSDAPSFQIKFFHIINSSITHGLLCVPSSFVAQVSFFLHVSCLDFQNMNFLIRYYSMLHGVSLHFPSCLMPQVWKSSFFNSIPELPLLASICMFKHRNPISYELAMKILIFSHTLVCAFLIRGRRFLFPSCLSPWV